jgi:hypothetical protein
MSIPPEAPGLFVALLLMGCVVILYLLRDRHETGSVRK